MSAARSAPVTGSPKVRTLPSGSVMAISAMARSVVLITVFLCCAAAGGREPWMFGGLQSDRAGRVNYKGKCAITSSVGRSARLSRRNAVTFPPLGAQRAGSDSDEKSTTVLHPVAAIK